MDVRWERSSFVCLSIMWRMTSFIRRPRNPREKLCKTSFEKKTTQHKIRILGISQKLIQVLYFAVRATVFESHSMEVFKFSML